MAKQTAKPKRRQQAIALAAGLLALGAVISSGWGSILARASEVDSLGVGDLVASWLAVVALTASASLYWVVAFLRRSSRVFLFPWVRIDTATYGTIAATLALFVISPWGAILAWMNVGPQASSNAWGHDALVDPLLALLGLLIVLIGPLVFIATSGDLANPSGQGDRR